MDSSTPLKPSQIPPSTSIVKVSIIDTTTRISGMKTEDFFKNPVPGHNVIDNAPSWAFLIEHETFGTKLLFDVGTRTDWRESLPPTKIAHYGWEVIVEKSIDTILREHGIGTDAIGGIIWSHAHWDHISDLSLFPNDVPLIVGPGFKEEYFPGWPDDEEGDVNADAWQNGREVIELDFQRSSTVKIDGQSLSNKTKYHVAKSLAYASPCSIAEMGAFDVFLDGSFYLLDAPGHSPAHLCALARTGPSTEAKSEFVLLGGDAFDHGGALRPSKYCHLPAFILETANLSSQLLDRTRVASAGTSVHARPFLLPDAFDFDSAVRTLAKLAGLDARADVLTICAHEKLSEADGIPVFLKQLNGWRERNVREPLLWRFLNDFK